LQPEELLRKTQEQIQELLLGRVKELYARKEVEFPVQVGMAQFMTDRGDGPVGARYDRDGLFAWASSRFEEQQSKLNKEEFETLSRAKLQEQLLEVSRACYPTKSAEDLDGKLDELFEGSPRPCDAEDAKELSDWLAKDVRVGLPAEPLVGKTTDEVRQETWNAFDRRYRPEMRQMERNLVLHQLDTAWKNHLYTMDHLRSGIGLVGYAQEDPKTVYKQEGMKEFRAMWEGVEDKVTELVFRMEESDAFAETIWMIGAATHESAPTMQSHAKQTDAGGQNQGSTGDVKVTDPIRHKGPRVGRNDPCPCGSGRKFKKCCGKEVETASGNGGQSVTT